MFIKFLSIDSSSVTLDPAIDAILDQFPATLGTTLRPIHVSIPDLVTGPGLDGKVFISNDGNTLISTNYVQWEDQGNFGQVQVSKKVNGQWVVQQNLRPPLNVRGQMGDVIFVSPDFEWIFVTKGAWYDPDVDFAFYTFRRNAGGSYEFEAQYTVGESPTTANAVGSFALSADGQSLMTFFTVDDGNDRAFYSNKFSQQEGVWLSGENVRRRPELDFTNTSGNFNSVMTADGQRLFVQISETGPSAYGELHVYDKDGNNWVHAGAYAAPSAKTEFGVMLTNADGTHVVMSRAHATNAESTGFFHWTRQGNGDYALTEIELPALGPDTTFGINLSGSADLARILVMGSSTSTNTIGAVHQFDLIDGVYVLTDRYEEPESTIVYGEYFGDMISISPDGSRAIIVNNGWELNSVIRSASFEITL